VTSPFTAQRSIDTKDNQLFDACASTVMTLLTRHVLPPQATIEFYEQQHGFYCGVDLHARNRISCGAASWP
jgi:hypothetical protein